MTYQTGSMVGFLTEREGDGPFQQRMSREKKFPDIFRTVRAVSLHMGDRGLDAGLLFDKKAEAMEA
ncbi:MAG: hypothetical protein N2509_08575 [Treponemataceae bacterium]|nr:hypothetical protein [Treponemataceae bacterium]